MLTKIKQILQSRRLWLWLAGVLGVYSLAGFVLAPWLIERQLVSLLQQRLSLQATVERISLNPFALTFSIDGLDIIDEEGRRLASLERAFVNMQLDSVTRRAFSFRELHLTGFHASVRRYSETDNNIARLATNWSESAVPESAPVVASEPGGLPRLLIADLRIEDASLAYTDNVPAIPFFTSVDSLDFMIENLNTLPEESAGQSLSLTMGNGSQVHWAGSLTVSPLRSEGHISLLGPYPDLVYSYLRDQLPVRLSEGWFEAGLDYRVGITSDGQLDVSVRDLNASLSDLLITSAVDGAYLARLPLIAVEGGALEQRNLSLGAVRLSDFDLHLERFSDGDINLLRLLPATDDSAAVADATAAVPAVSAQEPNASPGATTAPAPAVTGTASGAVDSWQLLVAEVALQNWAVHLTDRVPAEEVSILLGLNATLGNVTNIQDSPIALDVAATVSSGGALTLGGTLTVLPELQLEGELNLDDLALPVAQPYIAPFANISLDDGRFALAGNLIIAPDTVNYEGTLSLDEIRVTDTLQNEDLLGIGSLHVDGASVSAGDGIRIDIGELHIQKPYARIEIEADGSTNIGRLPIPRDSVSAPVEPEPESAEPGPLLPVTIQNIRIDDASADFSDSSLPLPFAVHMAALGGQISALSTRSSEPARIDIEGQVDEYGLVTISGQLRPLAPAELTEIDLRFRNLDIPSMSPYVIKFAGRRIADGNMDVDLSYRINDRQLSGDNSLVMRDLVLGDRVPHPDALDLPLGLAVALLKDRNGVIDLEVPVTGDLGNPQFSYGAVIRRALVNIITNIVSSPFRLLSNLIGGGDDEELGAVAFMPGRSDLAPPEREKLGKLAQALVERPQLQLKLTGVYAEVDDTQALQQQFLDRRIDEALAAATAAPASTDSNSAPASVTRTSVLESLYLAAGQGGDEQAAAAFLEQLRLQNTSAATADAEALFDEIAYAGALRRELLTLEPVSESDLQNLASARANAVATELGTLNPELVARARVEPAAGQAVLEDGWIDMAMELDVSQ